MPDLSRIREELDGYQKLLPGYWNRLNFQQAPGGYIAGHWWQDVRDCTPRFTVWSDPDPNRLMATLRRHIGALISPDTRMAAE
jgi:hypothetical protein